MSPLDLHVLSTPPAFVLSQDQTLMFNPLRFLASFNIRSPKLLLTSAPRGVSLISILTSFSSSLSLYRFQGSRCRFSRQQWILYAFPPILSTLFVQVYQLLTFKLVISNNISMEHRWIRLFPCDSNEIRLDCSVFSVFLYCEFPFLSFIHIEMPCLCRQGHLFIKLLQ